MKQLELCIFDVDYSDMEANVAVFYVSPGTYDFIRAVNGELITGEFKTGRAKPNPYSFTENAVLVLNARSFVPLKVLHSQMTYGPQPKGKKGKPRHW